MKYTFNWPLIFSGEYSQWFIDGLSVTLQLSGLSIVLALVLGTLLTVMRLSKIKPLVWFSVGYIEFFRNTPLVVQIFFWYFGSDPLLPGFFKEWLYRQNIEFATGVIALSTYTAAFIAEELRSGILSIPKTQLEASRATGLSFMQAMGYVILPQAFRIIIPPLISQFLNLIKNSSLAMTIGVMELTYMARQVEAHTFHGFEAFTVSTLMYLSLSLLVSLAINQYNKRCLHVRSR
ncbi:amino acid ABC transporter permease [Desulfomicrobium escambiense]|uniref:amino acid ABC transporter permease n=1 Tax=Desulfomicrobium escambiense TaxID=29503 RepID=UPI00040175D0|nr:amino acid ABC transporter permease [Desulfomicrobium escambiense]